MRRRIIVTLTLATAIGFAIASPLIARPVVERPLPVPRQIDRDETPLPVPRQIDRGAMPLPRAVETRADTLFLFAASGDGAFGSPGTDARGYTFDGPGGDAAPAGWYGHDNTTTVAAYWHLEDANLVDGAGTDMSAAPPFDPLDLSNDYAMHCGVWSACGWENPNGYGNNWDQRLRVLTWGFSDSLQLNFDFMGDFEGDDWDNFEVLLETYHGKSSLLNRSI